MKLRGEWHGRVAVAQGTFWLLTGVWPIVHMTSFLAVTGPKHDLWLVRTVGALIAVVGATLLLAGLRRRVTPEIALLGVAGALALTAVDVVYVSAHVIGPIYLLDAAAELTLVLAWAVAAWHGRR